MDVQTFKEVKVLVDCVIRYKELERQFHNRIIKWREFRAELAIIHQELIDAYGDKKILYSFLEYMEKEKENEAAN